LLNKIIICRLISNRT